MRGVLGCLANTGLPRHPKTAEGAKVTSMTMPKRRKIMTKKEKNLLKELHRGDITYLEYKRMVEKTRRNDCRKSREDFVREWMYAALSCLDFKSVRRALPEFSKLKNKLLPNQYTVFGYLEHIKWAAEVFPHYPPELKKRTGEDVKNIKRYIREYIKNEK